MNIEANKIGNLLIVKLIEDRLDADLARDFKNKVNQWVSQGEKFILLNLSEVKFIDSSGLGAILSILKNLGNRGNLALCRIGENVMSLFRLTRMNRVFQIFADETEAIVSLGRTESTQNIKLG
jgi:anti-sigma B factor antagonist